MDQFVELVTNVNGAVNGFVWGLPMLVLLVGTGILMTLLTKVFQVSHFGHWMKETIGGIFTNRHITAHTGKEDKSISQFQSLCTALAATIGTGNIVGVATAIALGGPGAIFWMWIVAIFGMMTNFSENVLGIFYRRKNDAGEWQGGAMYYLRDGLGGYKHCKVIGLVLATLFSIFAVLASFGIGNMSQIHSISSNMKSAFSIPVWVTGVVLMALAALIILGGLKRIAAVTEKLVPFMAIIYVVGALVIIGANAGNIGPAFVSIFKGAFQMSAVGGGIVGTGVKLAITWGMKRGVFSNEAGLGSSVMVHSSSNVKEPVKQGMWGIFEVFMDTIVVCTLTALVILTSTNLVNTTTGQANEILSYTDAAGQAQELVLDVRGDDLSVYFDLDDDGNITQLKKEYADQGYTRLESSSYVSYAFSQVFGQAGSAFIAIAILLFAFSTVLGWSHYGSTAFEYLFGRKATMGYKVIFVAFIVVGATMSLDLAWDLSDTFNGLMAIPNLIGVLSLSGVVMKITKNYIDRRFRHLDVEPMYSHFPDIQAQQLQSEAEDAAEDAAAVG